MLDNAPERSLQTDILFGLVRQLQRRRPRGLKDEIEALARALPKKLGAMQHEHQAATAKGPQPSSGSVSLACPLFVVRPFFATASAEL